MATVIDSLVISLGIDPSGFTKGQKEAIEQLRQFKGSVAQTSKEVEAEGKRAAQFFSQVKTEALSLIGVLVGAGGLEAFIKDTTASLARLGDQAMHIGVAAPQLAAFANMIKRQGGNAEAAAASFTALTDAMENYRLTGVSPMANFLNRIGVDRADNALTVLEKFQAFAAANSGDVPLINFIGHGIGLDQGTIDATVRMRTVAKMHEELAHSYELGVPTPEIIKNAKDFQGALEGLGQAAQQDGRILLNDLYPGLTKATEGLTKFIEQNPQALVGLAAIGGWLVTISALNFSALLAVLGRLTWLAPLLTALAATGNFGSSLPDELTPEELQRRRAAQEQEEAQPGYESPWQRYWREHRPRWLGGGGQPPIADQTMSPEQQEFLKRLSQPESGGDYNPPPNPKSSAKGRYQFTDATWKEFATPLGLQNDHSPAAQDRVALALASSEYYKKTGRSLFSDLQEGGHGAEIARALRNRWITITEQTGAGGTSAPQDLSHTLPRPWLGGSSSHGPAANTSNTSSVSVGTINVHTMATDATGIARDIGSALSDITIAQSNRGLQ